MTQPPEPLVPAEVDLRGLDYMPFFGHHLLGSEFHARCSDAEWRAGVTLWWAAWNQVPAASLPDDDVALCRLADLGRDVKGWKALRANALHGFVMCSDGRLYHKFIAEQALIAWEKRVNERKRKQRWRQGRNGPGDGDGTGTETGTSPSPGRGQVRGQDRPPDGDVPSDGTGRDGTITTSDAGASGAAAPPDRPATIWDVGEKLLGSRAYVTKLIAEYGESSVTSAIAECSKLNVNDPRSWVRGVLDAGRRSGSAGSGGVRRSRQADIIAGLTGTTAIETIDGLAARVD